MPDTDLIRYSLIDTKNCREIILLRGRGCSWRRCKFCDYHLDFNINQEENYKFNSEILKKVKGIYKRLEVINSGSFVDLDEKTMLCIEKTAVDCGITELYFECHWNHRFEITELKKRYASKNIKVFVKTGVETFDSDFREKYLDKGITVKSPEEIAEFFDECCLLFGLTGQNLQSMLHDIEIGLKYFRRICINIMSENTKDIKPDINVLDIFMREIYPIYINNERVDILLENTEFGVGGMSL